MQVDALALGECGVIRYGNNQSLTQETTETRQSPLTSIVQRQPMKDLVGRVNRDARSLIY